MKIGLIFLLVLMSQMVFAGTLQKTLEKYSKASSIEFDIKKIDEKIILGAKSESQGHLKYQKNKINIALKGEKKVEFYYSDKILTLVEYPDADFDPNGKRKVTILKKNTSPLIKSLINLFSNPKNFSKEFSVVTQAESEGVFTATLKSTQKNIKKFNIKINIQDLSLVEIWFVDDLDSKTTINFSNQQLNTKMNKADFQYQALKTDEVMSE